MSIFEIDPDIRKAKTLASDFYTDERYFDISKEKIFERSWQFLGKADEFDGLKPTTILPRISQRTSFTGENGRIIGLSFKRLHASREDTCRRAVRS